MRGCYPPDDARVWLSAEFSVAAVTLCLDRPESPNSDFLCVKARNHKGRCDHRWGIRCTVAPTEGVGETPHPEGGQ